MSEPTIYLAWASETAQGRRIGLEVEHHGERVQVMMNLAETYRLVAALKVLIASQSGLNYEIKKPCEGIQYGN